MSTHPRDTASGRAPEDDCWDSSAPAKVDPKTGQHRDHWVLPESERAKGFVRPVRVSYKHVGVEPPKNLRDLTPEEKARYASFGYAKYEEYSSNETCVTGRFWTQAQLDGLGGCSTVTTMSRLIAETYARDPGYYSQTFCCGCNKYLPVGANGEFVWCDGTRVGT